MNGALTVLVVGGYGTFGGRIVQLLEDEPRLTLIVSGRSLDRARRYCDARGVTGARLVPAGFDRDGDLDAGLAALRPDLLIDASGPFQTYGERPYRLIEACIRRGVNYLDLADGSDFVAGVHTFDTAAVERGLHMLCGVSSFPVLTAAVVRRLASSMPRVDAIRGGIAPSPYAGVGRNVVSAIAGYAGRRIPVRRDGGLEAGHPFTQQMRFTIAPPGRLPLRRTLFSLVDVPDPRALAELWPEAKTIWMGAGPVPEVLHRALIALAWLVRVRLIRSLSPLAPLMHWATNRLRWGEHRGGMFVEVAGAGAAGEALCRSWHLLAEGEDGPLIPSMGVEALVRGVLAGRSPSPGARAAVNDLELDDYEQRFAGRAIQTGVRDEASDTVGPLYKRVLGSAWDQLPAEMRAMHDPERTARAIGRGSVERGASLLARLAGAVVGFPRAMADTPVAVRFDAANGVETWTRTFEDERFSSRQFAGRGRSESLVCERFGPLTFSMALVLNGECLSLVMRRWSAFGLPLPMWLCPRSEASESVQDGKFHFHVVIAHPLTGLIVRYRGWLAPA